MGNGIHQILVELRNSRVASRTLLNGRVSSMVVNDRTDSRIRIVNRV
jgi:hypothetical protein